MFQSEEKISKNIMTPDGEDEFQIRFIHDENVGVLTTRSEKSYFILDSMEYWYDLIQERYPVKQKCRCKNDYFRIRFDYIPRIGTEDYRAVEVVSCCTECGKQRRLADIDIDYSPTDPLYEQPITFCKKPIIRYKTYSVGGFWTEDTFHNLLDFLFEKELLIYCWYWNHDDGKRYAHQMTSGELKKLLFLDKQKYMNVYFSLKSLDMILAESPSYEDGIYLARDIWRKNEVINLNSPLTIAVEGAGKFYSMDFCSEYLEAGQIIAKSAPFCQIVQELLAYSKKKLK